MNHRDSPVFGWRSRVWLIGILVGLASFACAVRPGDVLFSRGGAPPTEGENPRQAPSETWPSPGPRIKISKDENDDRSGPLAAPAPSPGASAVFSSAPSTRNAAPSPSPVVKAQPSTSAQKTAAKPADPAAPAPQAPKAAEVVALPPEPAEKPAPSADPAEVSNVPEAKATENDPAGAPDAGYVLGEEDVLEVTVLGEPDFVKVPARIGPKGTVELPYAGEIPATGLTVEQFRQALMARLNEFFVGPQVTVYLREYRSPMVHVLGEVVRPGPYKLTHHNTVMELISRAGGFTQLASRGKVRIIRKAPGSAENMLVVDAAKIIDDGRMDLDVALLPGDIIIVPESFL